MTPPDKTIYPDEVGGHFGPVKVNPVLRLGDDVGVTQIGKRGIVVAITLRLDGGILYRVSFSHEGVPCEAEFASEQLEKTR